MNWFKRIFRKKKVNQGKISVVVTPLKTDKCLCELNAKGGDISGWCREHRTDWL